MKKSCKKDFLFFFFLIIVFLSLSFLSVSAQGLDDNEEKQLKIFQLSQVLEEGDGFPQQHAYLKNALAYFHQEYFVLAISELEKITYNHLYIPLYFKGQMLQGRCYEKLERWESAIYTYQELMDEVPFMQDYLLYFLGKTYQMINDTRNALEFFQKLTEEYPHSTLIPLTRYQIALIYLQNEQLTRFLQESRSAIDLSMDDSFKGFVLSKMNDVLWEEGLLIDSLIVLKELIENRYNREHISSDEDLFVRRYQEIWQKGDIAIMPDLSLFCADILFSSRQYKIAETLYEQVIALYPDQIDLAQVSYNKARTIHYQGDYVRAIEQCRYILSHFDRIDIIVRTLYLYAGALLSSGNRSQALEKYQEIIQNYHDSYYAPSSYLRIAEIERLLGNEEGNIMILNQLISEYPQSDQSREACWNLARYYTNRNAMQEALSYYRFIHDHFSHSSIDDDSLFWLGKLQYQLNQEEGISWFHLLLNQFPDSYYTFRIPMEVIKPNQHLKNVISLSSENTVEMFKKDYFPKDPTAQYAAYKAEVLQIISLYPESILETAIAMKYEPDNAYLMYLLTETYSLNGEFYASISWAQALLNHFKEKGMIEKMPLQIWQHNFPVYYNSIVKKQADHYELDPYLVWSTIREESHFSPWIESSAGAVGLMQIMPSTGEWIAEKLNDMKFQNDLLYHPDVNIHLGCWYLQYLQDRFSRNYHLVISGYNAGPGVTDRWVETIDMTDLDSFIENIPYQETSEHIKKVLRSYMIYQIIYS